MRWIIGLDLRPRSVGALRFASWLGAESAPREPERFVAVHVLEEEHLRAALRSQHLSEVEAAARGQVRRLLDEEDPEGRIVEVEVVQSTHADEGLRAERVSRKADGAIIGRLAGADERRIVRLGRVARRLLRDPPGPTFVVPPDLRRGAVGSGPVVALTSLDADAEAACDLAAALAARLGRPLDLVHVVPHLAASSPEFVPAALLAEETAVLVAQGEKDLAAWIRARGLHPSRTHVLRGDLFDAAVLHAEQARAPFLVVGVHVRGGLERLVSPSIASELAATSTLPVLVVPASR
ncbi:MAG: universal stress protein [Anaeromyxobacter sp.]